MRRTVSGVELVALIVRLNARSIEEGKAIVASVEKLLEESHSKLVNSIPA
jgi:hypothetical protein